MTVDIEVPGENPRQASQRRRRHLKGRALEAWTNVRNTLRNEDAKTDPDVNDPSSKRSLTHGMQFMYSIPLGVSIVDVLFNETCQEYVLLDESGTVSIYRSASGRHVTNFLMDDKLERLLLLANLSRYVGLSRATDNPRDATFVVYTQNLKVLSTFLIGVPVTCILYNPFRRQIVTAGEGNIHSWTLHYEDTHILPEVAQSCPEIKGSNLEMIAYEHNAGYSQRIYAISNTTCFVFRATTLELLDTKRSLHVRKISSMAYFNPGKSLVTGSIDGTIKMWDESWCVKVVFVGHNAPVVSLGVYPNGPFVVSAASDNSIRVWSLETSDEALVLETHSTATDIVSQFGYEQVATVHQDELYVYKTEELYHLFTSIGEPAKRIRRSTRHENTRNLVCCCEDSTVRVVCPTTGKILNTVMFPEEDIIRDAVCIKKLNAVFCLLDDNRIVKANLGTNPAYISQTWHCDDIFPGMKVSSFCVYEHMGAQEVLNQGGATDSWTALARAAGTDELKNAEEGQKPKMNPVLLFVGRNDGGIAQIDMESSQVNFEVAAHEMSNITLLVENSAYDQMISAGTDKVVKVWKVFPFAQVEPLVIVFPFYFPGNPTHVSVCKNKIFVAFQDSASGLYSSVVHTQERTRFDHPRIDDHTDKIVAVAANPKMKLFASAGEDETVRIWSDHSRLIRCLRLNAHIWSMDFCSETGDLIIGISDHLYRIDHMRYFTKSLMYRKMTIPFENLNQETPVAYDEKQLEEMNLSDLKRLKAAHAADLKFSTFEDTLPEEEQKQVDEDREAELSKLYPLAKRDAELEMLRNSDFDPLKISKKQRNERIQQIAFKKYLSIFFENVKVELPKSDEPEVKAPPRGPGKFVPEKEPLGFFPPVDKSFVQESNSKVNISGYLPNSVALKRLYPEETLKAHEEAFKPREFTAAELEEMEFWRKQRENAAAENAFDEDEGFLMDDDLPPTPDVATKSDLLSKLQQAAKTPSPPPEPELSEAEREALERAARVQELQHAAQAKENKQAEVAEKKQAKPIRKLVSRPKQKSPEPPPTPVKPKRVFEEEVVADDTPRPPTPLPEWLTRNKNQDWYQKFFPDLNERTFPKPWVPAKFAQMVLRYIKTCDLQYKAPMIEYLKDIHMEYNLVDISDEIIEGLIFAINKTNGQTGEIVYGRAFFIACVHLFTALSKFPVPVLAQMMAIYLEKDITIKRTVVENLRKTGLEDPQKFFYKNLDSWDLPAANDPNYRKEVVTKCERWLKAWMQKLVEQTEYVIEELKSGSMVLPGPIGKRFSKEKKLTSSEQEEPSRSVVAVLERIMGDHVDSVTPMEALNYYAECELIDFLARGDEMRKELLDPSNNRTVLVLPKVQIKKTIPRVGELSTGKGKQKRDESFASLRNPPTEQSLFSFPNHINLPMKPVYMNPFRDEVEEFVMKMQKQQPVLLTLKSQQKFFVPSNSVAPPS